MRPVALRLGLPIAVLPALVLGGCAARFLHGPLGDAAAQPRDKGCAFSVTDVIPDRPFDTLGVLAPEDIEASRLPTAVPALEKIVAADVCRSGGDAVVVERDQAGRFVRATIIKLR